MTITDMGRGNPESGNDAVLELLEQHLATAIDLHLRLKHLLWNASNPQISEIWWLSTALLEIESFCDLIAVRLRSLGAVPSVTPHDVHSRSLLEPVCKDETEERERLKEVLHGLDRLSRHASEAQVNATALSDETTAKLFAKIAYTACRQLSFVASSPK